MKGLALVTGGGGFLGRRIVELLLARGRRVRVLGRGQYPDLRVRGVEVVCGDVADPEVAARACQGAGTVFHAAAKAGVWGPRREFVRTNVEGTLAVLAACRRGRVPRLVYTGSPSVCFDGTGHEMVDESAPYARTWLCSYPETKAEAERAVLSAHAPGSLATVSLRPHLLWGPGDPHLLPRVIARARTGRLAIVGGGRNRVDLTHVDNAAAAHLLAEEALLAGKAGGRAFFITNGEPVELWPWIAGLLGRLGLPAPARRVPAGLAYAAGAALEAVHGLLGLRAEPFMTRFTARQLSTHHTHDISAARAELGYAPVVTMSAGLEDLARRLRGEPAGR